MPVFAGIRIEGYSEMEIRRPMEKKRGTEPTSLNVSLWLEGEKSVFHCGFVFVTLIYALDTQTFSFYK